MAKGLIVSPQILYPQNSGFRKSVVGRIFNDFKEDNLYLLQINGTGEDSQSSHKFFSDAGIPVETIKLPQTNRRNFKYCLRFFISCFRPLPWHAQNLNRKILKNRISELVKQHHFDFIVCEQIYTLSSIPKHLHSKCRIIFHNVETLLLRDQASVYNNPFVKTAFILESLKTCKYEHMILKTYTENTYFLSEQDACQFQIMFKMKLNDPHFTANKLYLEYSLNRSTIENFILFTGNMTFEPNLHGLLWFAQNLYNRFERDFPDTLILVTGYTPYTIRKKFVRFENIHFTGYLQNKEMKQKLESCRLIMSPILKGSGIKVKNLEAIQYNIPLVMTKKSAAGIPYYEHLDNTTDSFYRSLSDCLQR